MAYDESTCTAASRLVLGGHSFITQLGNDPAATADQQADIVRACLRHGIDTFDTTYQPERVALGRALRAADGIDQARVIAWNFFRPFGPGDDVGGPAAYQPDSLPRMLDELGVERVDYLVVHPVGDPQTNRHQEELAISWQEAGLVRQLGLWAPGPDLGQRYPGGRPYSFMIHPGNVTTSGAEAVFAVCHTLGWQTFACSPFVRGWELDRLAAATSDGDGDPDLRARLADHMVRFALYAPHVDRLIVSMRRGPWVAANAASAQRGPLSDAERTWLMERMARSRAAK